jgi:AraC-like DNA-binding protein
MPRRGGAAVRHLDTASVPEIDRLDYWHDGVCRSFVPLETKAGPGAFDSRLTGICLGQLQLSVLDASAQVVRRTPALIRKSPGEYYKLALQLRGRGVLEQDGRQTALTPGDLTIYDVTRPYRVAFREPFQMMVVLLPRLSLRLPIEVVAQITATPICGSRSVGSMAASYLTGLMQHSDELSPASSARLADHLLDLLALLCADHVEANVTGFDWARHALRMRVYSFIEDNLRDPQLSPQTVADAHHISLRALHKLFEAEDTTVARHIRQSRLWRCRRDLVDPGLAGRSVSAVAAGWGLFDAAQFSKSFRAAHGISPRDYRMAMGHAAAGP